MAEERLQLTFHGAAVAAGRMDVRDLAPSLIALADLLHESQRTLYPDDPQAGVQVRASQPGSFEVDLVVVSGLWDQLCGMLTSDDNAAAVNLIAYVTAAKGLLNFIVRMHRRFIRRREDLPAGMVRLQLDDGTTLEVSRDVLDLYQQVEVRRAVHHVMEPLARDGIDEVRLSHRQDTVTVRAESREAFEVPPADDEVVNETTRDLAVSIASVAFVDGNKWRLSDGETTFYAAVEDEYFLGRINRNEERFAKGDLLKVRLRTRQWRGDAGLRTEYAVEEVVAHIAAARQLSLPYEAEPPLS